MRQDRTSCSATHSRHAEPERKGPLPPAAATPRFGRARALLTVAAVVIAGRALEGCGGKDLAVLSHDGGADATASAIGDHGAASGAGAGGRDGSGGVVSSGNDASLLPGGCTGGADQPLRCYVDMSCPGGASTTLKGTVFDPAGKNPLADVLVFVPYDRSPLPPIATGTRSCSSCATEIGDYTVAALTETGASS